MCFFYIFDKSTIKEKRSKSEQKVSSEFYKEPDLIYDFS